MEKGILDDLRKKDPSINANLSVTFLVIAFIFYSTVIGIGSITPGDERDILLLILFILGFISTGVGSFFGIKSIMMREPSMRRKNLGVIGNVLLFLLVFIVITITLTDALGMY